MRSVSKKRASDNRRHVDARRLFLLDHPHCWCCGRLSECIDEIARGASRVLAIREPCTWIAACGLCNTGELNDPGRWPVARKLALKKRHDLAGYDRRTVNQIRGRQPEAITEHEVDQWTTTLP